MFQLIYTAALLNASKNVARTNLQFVRYNLRYKRKEPFRKPVWQTIAPSKLYRIKKRDELSAEEQAQRDHLNNTYSVNMKSIRKFLNEEFYLPTLEAGGRSHDDVLIEGKEQQQLIEENKLENERIAALREERIRLFRLDKDAKLLAQQLQNEETNKRLGEEFDLMVKREIERSKTFITKENLDSKIEELLTNQTSYDFAIDHSGKVIFSGSLHPYALTPKAVPEISSNTEEYKETDQSKPVYIKVKRLF